jgi:hypothetical protein
VATVRRGGVWQVQVRVGKDLRTGKWIRRAATCDSEAEGRRVERRLLAEAETQRARFVAAQGSRPGNRRNGETRGGVSGCRRCRAGGKDASFLQSREQVTAVK